MDTLLEGAAHMIKGQYAFGFDERSVTLTTVKELDLGNGYAAAGDWKAAKESWERADAHKTGPDRSFSLGVAQEALAYDDYAATRKFEEPKKMLKVALQSYKESLDGAARDRAKQQRAQMSLVAVPKSIGYLDELEKLQQIRELAAQAAEAAPPAAPSGGPGGKNLDEPAATPESKKFRELLERQITAIPDGKPSEEQQQRWRALGETAFKMSPEGSRKVVEQVIAGRKDSMVRMGQYRDSMMLYLADKIITRKEREDLKTLQDALQLTPEAVAEVEAKLKPFTEEGVDAPPVVRPTNPRARPVVK
jgi:tetratricopeptide (TPR) repeat protein